jgi:predicted DNA-binding transcriptional regulator AlpA
VEVDPDELIRSEDVAKMLGVKPQTLIAWRCEGKGPRFCKIGRLAFYRRADLRAYIGTLLRDPAAKAERAA